MATLTDKTLACIKVLLESPSGTTVYDLSVRAGLSRPATTRLVESLIKDGIAFRDAQSRRISLGLKLYDWATRAVYRDFPLSAAQPEQLRLSEELQRGNSLVVMEGTEVVVLQRCEPVDRRVLMEMVPSRFTWHKIAVGKVIVAGQSAENINRLCDKLAQTVPDVEIEALRTELTATRERGWAEVWGDALPSLFGVAAAVRGHSGEVVASIGTRLREEDMRPETKMGFVTPLLEATRRISQTLGYHEDSSPAV